MNRIRIDLNLALTDFKTLSVAERSKKKPKFEDYDFNSNVDRLWREFKGAMFSDVAEAIGDEVKILKDYEKRMGELKLSLDSDKMALAANSTYLDDSTARLSSAVR